MANPDQLVILEQGAAVWNQWRQEHRAILPDLSEAAFSEAMMDGTVFGAVDLSGVKGLDTVRHWGPSTIGIDTIYASHGDIPEAFLKGAGVDDTFIEYIHSLVGKPIQYYSCFISYSSKDDALFRHELSYHLNESPVPHLPTGGA